MSKFGRRIKEAPEGYEYLEETILALENELREKVNEPHEGLRKNESQWPIHQINWQKSRYIYDMYYTFKKISKEVYDYCITNKIADAALIAKWKRPGYERLCSTYVVNPRNYKFGTVSICRVPKQFLTPGTEIEDPTTGCRGCASGSGENIFGSKYGQYLAAIQIARENRQAMKLAKEEAEKDDDEDEDNNESGDEEKEPDGESTYKGPVGAADGSSGTKANANIWATNESERNIELSEEMIGELAPEAQKEAILAAAKAGSAIGGDVPIKGPPGKRTRRN
mmetsp:Transcript_8717/g.12988  ORF Transcript_8717/g.12988 Transcript_8717/m.12988 type:complete len:281 (-) Transcript_8717:2224-3066(-)